MPYLIERQRPAGAIKLHDSLKLTEESAAPVSMIEYHPNGEITFTLATLSVALPPTLTRYPDDMLTVIELDFSDVDALDTDNPDNVVGAIDIDALAERDW
jgi:hypothetical protein